MPDKRKHRGANPADEKLFASDQQHKMAIAANDLAWLLGKGYGDKASLKLVGDRYRLKQRQRLALSRIVCTEIQRINRNDKALQPEALAGELLLIDGFNLLITIESALSGGFIFEGLDGCYRDLASIHGTYKRVIETDEALELIGKVLCRLNVKEVTWLMDKPVSNSGRLKSILKELAEEQGWPWQAELVNNPDTVLIQSTVPIVSSDSLILDLTASWFNLNKYLIDNFVPQARILHFNH